MVKKVRGHHAVMPYFIYGIYLTVYLTFISMHNHYFILFIMHTYSYFSLHSHVNKVGCCVREASCLQAFIDLLASSPA